MHLHSWVRTHDSQQVGMKCSLVWVEATQRWRSDNLEGVRSWNEAQAESEVGPPAAPCT